MNVELLNRVIAFHEEVPTRFNMNTWYEHVDPLEGPTDSQIENLGIDRAPRCGTVACVAGTVCILEGLAEVADVADIIEGIKFYDEPAGGWMEAAQKALGLTYPQACRLFYHNENMHGLEDHRWPEQFEVAYTNARNATERVQVLKDRVAHFIATDGQE